MADVSLRTLSVLLRAPSRVVTEALAARGDLAMRGSNRALDPKLLVEAAAEIEAMAEDQQTAVALVGGFALQYFGSARLTGNIDVISSAPLIALEPTAQLNFGGQKAIASNGVPVDVIVRNDDFVALYEDSLAHLVDVGAPMLLVQPEYIAAMKMVAGRRRDEDDLDFLIRDQVIDIAKATRVIRQHLGAYAAKEFTSFVKVAK